MAAISLFTASGIPSGLINVTNIDEAESRASLPPSPPVPPSPLFSPRRASIKVKAKASEPENKTDTTLDPNTIPHVYGDIVRTVHFYQPPRYGSPPRFLVAHPNGSGIKNFSTAPVKVTMRDIRDKEHRFHLALHSFKPLRHLPALPYPLDLKDPGVAAAINTSTTELIKRHVPSPNKITVFSTSILNAKNPIGGAAPTISHPLQIDQTPGAAVLRAKRHLSSTISSQISTGQLSLRIINIYRPILPEDKKITDHQLCVCESQSIADHDLVHVDHVYPDRVGQTYAVRHAEGQRFWYWSDIGATEGIIMQVYDSLLGCDSWGNEKAIRAASGFFKLMPQGYREGSDAEWLVIRAMVVA